LAREDEDRMPRVLASFVAVLLVMTACLMHFLPREFAALVVTWVILSISVGISFGHCVLNDP
jgi:formate/nitrite transporter FocA (FNT family)